MSPAFLKRLGATLVVLLVIWLGARVIRGMGQTGAESFEPVKLDRAAVDAVTIERPTDTVRLVKQGVGWTVNGFAASKTAADELVAALADSSAQGEVIAESATSHKRLGVDSAAARKIVARQGNRVLLTYLVGKRGASYESAYLRLPGQNVVYQVRGRLVEYAERKPDDWRDKQILAIEPDSVSSVEVHRGKKEYTLTRSGKAWTVGGAAADSAGVAGLLNQFRHLEATGFASKAQEDSARFEPADRTIRLAGAGGRPLASLALDSTSGGYWVRRDSLPVIYRLDQWTVNQLTPTDSSLRKK